MVHTTDTMKHTKPLLFCIVSALLAGLLVATLWPLPAAVQPSDGAPEPALPGWVGLALVGVAFARGSKR